VGFKLTLHSAFANRAVIHASGQTYAGMPDANAKAAGNRWLGLAGGTSGEPRISITDHSLKHPS
jgi:hypothetical protein